MPKPTRTLATLLRHLERHEAGLPGVDPVHDMRVATRRLRAALRRLRLRELDPPVKKLQDALGGVCAICSFRSLGSRVAMPR